MFKLLSARITSCTRPPRTCLTMISDEPTNTDSFAFRDMQSAMRVLSNWWASLNPRVQLREVHAGEISVLIPGCRVVCQCGSAFRCEMPQMHFSSRRAYLSLPLSTSPNTTHALVFAVAATSFSFDELHDWISNWRQAISLFASSRTRVSFRPMKSRLRRLRNPQTCLFAVRLPLACRSICRSP